VVVDGGTLAAADHRAADSSISVLFSAWEARRLQQPVIGEGEVVVAADDKVVVDLHVDALAGLLEPLGDAVVVLAGREVA